MKSETSLARIEANRQNAKKSTGPKDTSPTRFNAERKNIHLHGDVQNRSLQSQRTLEIGRNCDLASFFSKEANSSHDNWCRIILYINVLRAFLRAIVCLCTFVKN